MQLRKVTGEALAALKVHGLHAHGKMQLRKVTGEALAALKVHGLHAHGKVQLPDIPDDTNPTPVEVCLGPFEHEAVSVSLPLLVAL